MRGAAIVLSTLLPLLALGCAANTNPRGSKAERAAAMQFPPPSEGMARVYVFRSGLPMFTSCRYDMAGVRVRLAPHAFAVFQVEPGTHHITAKCGAAVYARQVVVEAGEIYYLDSTFEVERSIMLTSEERGRMKVLLRTELGVPAERDVVK